MINDSSPVAKSISLKSPAAHFLICTSVKWSTPILISIGAEGASIPIFILSSFCITNHSSGRQEAPLTLGVIPHSISPLLRHHHHSSYFARRTFFPMHYCLATSTGETFGYFVVWASCPKYYMTIQTKTAVIRVCISISCYLCFHNPFLSKKVTARQIEHEHLPTGCLASKGRIMFCLATVTSFKDRLSWPGLSTGYPGYGSNWPI